MYILNLLCIVLWKKIAGVALFYMACHSINVTWKNVSPVKLHEGSLNCCFNKLITVSKPLVWGIFRKVFSLWIYVTCFLKDKNSTFQTGMKCLFSFSQHTDPYNLACPIWSLCKQPFNIFQLLGTISYDWLSFNSST